MRRVICLFIMILLATADLSAQTVASDLVGLGMKSEQADYLAGILPGGSVLGNNTALKGRNQANSADISILKVDTTDDTVLLSDTGDVIKLNPIGDANRLFTFNASSDTAHTLTWGDAGTTATQTLTISASTSNGDDDSTLILCGGGANSAGNGACISLLGNETAGKGDVEITTGSDANSDAIVSLSATAGVLRVKNASAADVFTITESTAAVTSTGTITSSRTTDLGWAVVDGTDNTACTSQCTSAAVFGFDLSGGATAPVIKGPSDATSDICLCAGAS